MSRPRRWARRQWGIAALIVALLAVAAGSLLTVEPAAGDRAYALEQRLRCPVCKSVSIAESPSATAADLRLVVADQVAAGRSDEQIIAYFTDRYGKWVLLDPPVQGETLLLWLLPLAAVPVVAGIIFAWSRRPQPDAGELPDPDRSRVESAVREYRSRPEEDEP